MMWKGKADIVCTDKLIDLKTTGGSLSEFKWSARKYNYDSQCYIYGELFQKPLVFYVVNKTNQMLGIYEPSAEFIERGRNKVTEAIKVYNKFFSEESEFNINDYYVNEIL